MVVCRLMVNSVLDGVLGGEGLMSLDISSARYTFSASCLSVSNKSDPLVGGTHDCHERQHLLERHFEVEHVVHETPNN